MKWIIGILVFFGTLSIMIGIIFLATEPVSSPFIPHTTIGIRFTSIGASLWFIALILYFRRRVVGSITKSVKFFWATKPRRVGLVFTTIILIAVIVFAVLWMQHQSMLRETSNILHYDGNSWSEMSSGTTSWLNDVWGSSASDVFAVGDTTILHYDGNGWSEISSRTAMFLCDIWGSSASDIFAVGHIVY